MVTPIASTARAMRFEAVVVGGRDEPRFCRRRDWLLLPVVLLALLWCCSGLSEAVVGVGVTGVWDSSVMGIAFKMGEVAEV